MKNSKRRRFIENFLPITLMIICLGTILYQGYIKNNEYILEQNAEYLQDTTRKNAESVQGIVDKARKDIKIIADFPEFKEFNTTGVNYQIIDKYEKLFDYYQLMYFGLDGVFVDVSGKRWDISQNPSFRDAFSGQSGILIAPQIAENRKQLVFYAPVIDNGTVEGILCGVYNPKEFFKSMFVTYFEEKSDVFICQDDGTIICTSIESDVQENIYDYLKGKQIGDNTSLSDVRDKSFVYNFKTKDYACVASFDNNNMYLVQTFPTQINNKMMKSSYMNKMYILIRVTIIFSIYLIWQLVKYYKQGHTLKVRNRVVAALGEIFLSISYIDVNDNVGITFRDNDINNTEITKAKADKKLEEMIENTIIEEDRADARKFFDFNAMSDNFNDKPYEFYEYKNMDNQWCKLYMIPTDFDKNGKIDHVVIAGAIIDEQKQLEEHLKIVEHINERLLTQMEIIECLCNVYNWVLYVDVYKDKYIELVSNCRMQKELTYIDDFTNKTTQMISYLESEKLKKEIIDFLELKSINNRLLKRDCITKEVLLEKYGWCRISIVSAKRDDKGNITNVICTFENIDIQKKVELDTQLALRKAYESTLAANNAKMDFLSKMSHDIRTPLNAILGMTSIAKAKIEELEKVYDCLEKIEGSGKHLLSLVNEVLDMSKIESGKLSIQEEIVDLPELVKETVEMMRPQIRQKKHKLTLDVNHIKHKKVYIDPMRIKQIIINVAGNSIKYTMNNGEILVKLEEGKSKDNDIGCYHLTISDNGIGMTKEDMEHIFEPFFRCKDTRVNNIQGTGLGMPIVKNILQLMGGDIQVSSEVGKGTTFVVTLFLKYDNEVEAEVKEVAQDYKPKYVLENVKKIPRVLIVDDNELNREVAMDMCTINELKSDSVDDGAQAVEKLKNSEQGYYDLVFMDIQMPVMNGYEATVAIRNLERDDLRNIPIVAMSANAFREDIVKAEQAGMNDYISKPVDMQSIKDTVKKWTE